MAVSDFLVPVQKLYIAYYGRPADPDGLLFWADSANKKGLSQVVGAFGSSAEANELFGSGPTNVFLNKIFVQMFGRGIDSEGLAYWTGRIEGTSSESQISRAQAALAILEGAQDGDPLQGGTLDRTIINNKLAVSQAFTSALNTAQEKAAYAGTQAAVTMRNYLASIDENTVPANENVQAQIDALIAGPTFTPNADTIVGTAGDDVFVADNTQLQSVTQSQDSLDGAGGYDQLTIVGDLDATAPRILNIEKIVLQDSVSAVDQNGQLVPFNLSSTASGLTDFAIEAPQSGVSVLLPGDAVLESISLKDVDFSSAKTEQLIIGAGNAGQNAYVLNLQNVVTSASDLISLALNNARVLTLNSSGQANVLGGTLNINSSQPMRLVAQGSTALDLGALAFASNVTSINASELGGAFKVDASRLNSALEITGSAFNDVLVGSTGGVDTLIGGKGNDTFILSNLGESDVVLGGDGQDVVQVATSFGDAQFNNGTTQLVQSVETIKVVQGNVFGTISGVIGSGAQAAGVQTLDFSGLGSSLIFVLRTTSAYDGNLAVLGSDSVNKIQLELPVNGTISLNTAAQDIAAGKPEAIDEVTISGFNAPSIDIKLDLSSVGDGKVKAANSDKLAVSVTQAGDSIPAFYMDDEGVNLFAQDSGNVANLFNGDVLIGSGFAGIFLGTSDKDTVTLANVKSFAAGGQGDDVLTGGAASDYLIGGAGNDTLKGNGGSDTFIVDSGTDVISDFSLAEDALLQINSGAVAKIFALNSGLAQTFTSNKIVNNGTLNIVGSTAGDIITGTQAKDVIVGGAGNDTLTGAAGSDVLAGLAGADTIDLTDTDNKLDEVHFNSAVSNADADVISGFDASTAGKSEDLIVFLDNGNALNGSVNFKATADTDASAFGTKLSASDFVAVSTQAVFAALNRDSFVVKVGTEAAPVDLATLVTVGGGSVTNSYVVGRGATGVEIYFDDNWANTADRVKIATLTGVSLDNIDLTDFAVYAS